MHIPFSLASTQSLRQAACALALLASAAQAPAQNALQRSVHDIDYTLTMQGAAASGDVPLWLTANRYGLSSVDNYGLVRASLLRSTAADSARRWRIGYGLDVAAGVGMQAKAVVQQLYADVEYRRLRLTVGSKQEPLQLKHHALSSGSQTLGINARPVPGIRLSVPEYLSITGRSNWAAIKGHISYGMMTDYKFQQDYTGPNGRSAQRALLHTKAGYLRIGNEKKFPLTFEGGLEMACQFGGTIYNAEGFGEIVPRLKMKHGLGAFVDALLGTGSDATDGEGYANAAGNTLGSWLLRLNYKAGDWRISAYYDHFFEDHSMMFGEYGWRDGMYGMELQLPHNPVADAVVYEFMNTTYQSGPVYHDHTEAIPDQISGRDNYYHHNLYLGWQHAGQAMGNPLFSSPLYDHTSPLYNHTKSLTFASTRFKAHHVGVSGTPVPALAYRLLYTHERSLGTYNAPYLTQRRTHSLLCEVNVTPERFGGVKAKGWQVGAAFAMDHGTLLGNNTGFEVKVAYHLHSK